MPKSWPPLLVRVRDFYRLKWTIRNYRRNNTIESRIETHTDRTDGYRKKKHTQIYGLCTALCFAVLLCIYYCYNCSSCCCCCLLSVPICETVTLVVGFTYKWPTTTKNPFMCRTEIYWNTRFLYVIEKSRVLCLLLAMVLLYETSTAYDCALHRCLLCCSMVAHVLPLSCLY